MDLKGQRFCERLFLYIMWPVTVLSCLSGFVMDDVLAIFKVFGAGLTVSAVVSCDDTNTCDSMLTVYLAGMSAGLAYVQSQPDCICT